MYAKENTLDCAARRFVPLPAPVPLAPCGVDCPLAGDEGECCASTEWPSWPTPARAERVLVAVAYEYA